MVLQIEEQGDKAAKDQGTQGDFEQVSAQHHQYLIIKTGEKNTRRTGC